MHNIMQQLYYIDNSLLYEIFTDQPPAYPCNDKPPDYHDICPRKTVSSPPVDIPPPDYTPTVHILPTNTVTSSNMHNSNNAAPQSSQVAVVKHPVSCNQVSYKTV